MAKMKSNAASVPVVENTSAGLFPSSLFTNFRSQCIILVLICFALYANTFGNAYAYDDTMVISSNAYVQDGFGGIKNILTKETYESTDSLSKGINRARLYRPLSLVTFAIEQQLFGNKETDMPPDADIHLAHIRHFVNVLFYALSVLLILYMLRLIVFRQQVLTAFIAVLIFAVHPIHTEVVANIKGRDEILCLLFICLTFIYSWKYNEQHKKSDLIVALAAYLLALLSKEYAVTLVVLVPLSFVLFGASTFKNSLNTGVPILLVLLLYLSIRYAVVPFAGAAENKDIVTNAYLLASGTQKAATVIGSQLWYLRLLIFPQPLCCDYSYNQIPYMTFNDSLVWLSLMVYTGICIVMIAMLKRRKDISFAIAFFLLNWLLVSNLIINRGGTISERLIYHSSLGFAIVLSCVFYYIYQALSARRLMQNGLLFCFSVLLILCAAKTIARNADWENNFTLFLKDVQTCPNSVVLNYNAGTSSAMMADMPENQARREDLLVQAEKYWSKALSIYPEYLACYTSRATAYMLQGEFEKAKKDIDTLRKKSPRYYMLPSLSASYYVQHASQTYANKGQYKEAIGELLIAADTYPGNAEVWRDLGMLYASTQQYDSSLNAWQHVLAIIPADTKAQQQYNAVKKRLEARK